MTAIVIASASASSSAWPSASCSRSLITSVSLRLLGMRRGLGDRPAGRRAGLGRRHRRGPRREPLGLGADGLVLHLVAIGIPATMTAAVALDLLARPGSLAIGERAGLVVAPRPLRAVRRRIDVFRRYRELVRLARTGGLRAGAGRADQAGLDSQAVRLRRVLEAAGGVYVKLGQIAATRVDLLPSDVCAELATLQNRVPPEPRDGIAGVLAAELGDDLDAVFAEFDWEPLAAASIGQTHRARLRTGEAVVVKIQRPGIEATMERDLAALALLADLAQRRTVVRPGRPVGRACSPSSPAGCARSSTSAARRTR